MLRDSAAALPARPAAAGRWENSVGPSLTRHTSVRKPVTGMARSPCSSALPLVHLNFPQAERLSSADKESRENRAAAAAEGGGSRGGASPGPAGEKAPGKLLLG